MKKLNAVFMEVFQCAHLDSDKSKSKYDLQIVRIAQQQKKDESKKQELNKKEPVSKDFYIKYQIYIEAKNVPKSVTIKRLVPQYENLTNLV